jgi:hypothetical protein
MTSSWQTEAGHIVCHWSEAVNRVQDNPRWMQEASDIQGSYLEPITHFASHSPFGRRHWFERIPLVKSSN